MTTYFAPIARLLGDLVVSFPPLQSLIAKDDDVCLIIRSPAQEGLAQRIPGLSKFIRESEFLRLPDLSGSKIYNLRDHPLQTKFVWGSPEFYNEYPGYGISEVIRQICGDLGIADGQEQLLALQFFVRPDCLDKVILIPGTAAPIKRWPSNYWLQLHKELKALGIESVMIGEPRENSQISGLMKDGMPWVATRTLADALDAISSAAGVVSVDTGLMHLAVHQGLKTVAVFRQYTMFLRAYPHARNVLAPDCAAECRAREFGFCPNVDTFFSDWGKDGLFDYWNGLNCQLENGSGCLSYIKVEAVLAQMAANGMI